MLYGKYPYVGHSDCEILQRIRKTPVYFSGVEISHNARDFIAKCLTVDPKKRISWPEIYEHSLMKHNASIIYGMLKSSKINFDVVKDFYNKCCNEKMNGAL